MNTLKNNLFVFIAALAFSFGLSSCENNPEVTPQEDLLPTSIAIDIPSSISNSDFANGRKSGRTKGDSIKGNDIYQNLGTFIAVGEGSAQLVEEFIEGIRKYKIDRVKNLTYISEDDNRTKNLIVESNITFENQAWDYQLTITDADSESQADGGKALQIFWNKSARAKGIAIIKLYNCDRIEHANVKDAIFRIDYSEGESNLYDAQMEVWVTGLPLENPLNDPYSISTLHMFAGKKGDVVDVYGNSNHPNAIFIAGNKGFNWAFVASGNEVKDVGVAEVGLPPSTLDNSDHNTLLKEYSIKNVFTNEINTVWPGIDQALVAGYLKETAAPGFFSKKKGFISGGVSPGSEWDVLTPRLDALTPYSPKATSELTLSFK
jgi:hypothetical protein